MDLTEKYRPKDFDSVIGQNTIVKSLTETINNGSKQAFIFSGPSGVGKTTLARICTNILNVGPFDLHEIDAATNSGVNDSRRLSDIQNTYPMGGKRAFIIDECHNLSKSAWDALLKPVEDSPDHTYWFFCTTELKKIPKTIKTRCSEYILKSVSKPTLNKFISNIIKLENLDLSDDYVELVSDNSDGSPRQALSVLEKIKNLSIDDAKDLVIGEIAIPEVIDFVRSLKDFNYINSIKLLKEIKSISNEIIRVSVFRYYASILLNSPHDKDCLKILSKFSKECVAQNGVGDIILRLAMIEYQSNK